MAATITASEARDGLLFPALDALALNQQQALAMINTSREIDSVVEKVAALRAHGVPGHVLRDLLHDCQTVITLNHAEGEHERTVTQTADRITDRAHRARTGRAPRQGLTVKQAAARLRPALRALTAHQQDAPAQMSVARAHMTVFDVIAQMSASVLLGSGMQVELGCRQFRLLGGLLAEHEQHEREASNG